MDTFFVYQCHTDGKETLYKSGLSQQQAQEEFETLDRLIASGCCGDGCAVIGNTDRPDDRYVAQRLGLLSESSKIKAVSRYKGRFCAELHNGKFVLSDGLMELLLCEKVSDGMKVIAHGIIGGTLMRNEEEFRWCVENSKEF